MWNDFRVEFITPIHLSPQATSEYSSRHSYTRLSMHRFPDGMKAFSKCSSNSIFGHAKFFTKRLSTFFFEIIAINFTCQIVSGRMMLTVTMMILCGCTIRLEVILPPFRLGYTTYTIQSPVLDMSTYRPSQWPMPGD